MDKVIFGGGVFEFTRTPRGERRGNKITKTSRRLEFHDLLVAKKKNVDEGCTERPERFANHFLPTILGLPTQEQ